MRRIETDKYRKVPFKQRRRCLVCGRSSGEAIIELPDFPMTEIYISEKPREKLAFCDQDFYLCPRCGHGQIGNVIDVGLQYGDNLSYSFRASESLTGRESADFFIEFLKQSMGKRLFRTVVELGCNDMYMLKALKNKAARLIGIDPILRGRENEFSRENILAIGDFFENISLDESPDAVICKDTLEHIDDPRGFIEKVVSMSDEKTLFFFQFPLLETLLAGCRFDHIFHQHLNYFSFKSLNYMLENLGCQLLDYRINYNHWGAIIIVFRRTKKLRRRGDGTARISPQYLLGKYKVFRKGMESACARLSFLGDRKIYGYGAALMLPVLGYHLGDYFSGFECIIDDNPQKQGLYYINLPVSIRGRNNIKDFRGAAVMITAIASRNNIPHILKRALELDPEQVIIPINNI